MRQAILLLTLICTAAPAMARNEVIGTVEATIDGEQTTWYLLQPPGNVPPTALWVAAGPDRGITSLSAYASTDLEFIQDATTGATVPAEDAPVLLISFGFPVDAQSASYTLPTDEGPAAVVLLDNWRDVLKQLTTADGPGRIEATAIDASTDGPSTFEGTFEGTLKGLTSDETRALTHGTFTTDAARLHPPR